jgi:hypothetical protein
MNNNFLDNMVNDELQKEAEARGQYNLDLLKKELEKYDNDKYIEFDVGGSPIHPHSYRGFYEQLAFEPNDEEEQKVGDFIDALSSTNGQIFSGYKGGKYTMHEDTMVWAAQYGVASGLAVVGVKKEDEKIIIKTKDTYEE